MNDGPKIDPSDNSTPPTTLGPIDVDATILERSREDVRNADSGSFKFIPEYVDAVAEYGRNTAFMQRLGGDHYVQERNTNYESLPSIRNFALATWDAWKSTASALVFRSALSMASIGLFLSITLVKGR